MTHTYQSLKQTQASTTNDSNTESVLKEIREVKVMLEDAALGPQFTTQQTQLISDLNDSLESAIDIAVDTIRTALTDEFSSLRSTSESIESKTDSILELIQTKLISDHSKMLRSELLSRLTLPLGEITVSNTKIGEGGFGSVYLGSYRGTTSTIAIKQIKHQFRESDRQAVENEVLLMDSCRSPNFLFVYGLVHVQSVQCYSLICMELASHGSLSQFLQFHPFPVSLVTSFLLDIIAALEYLHSKRIIHRDVKTDNVLLTEFLQCKLIDFGLAKEQLSSTLGTPSKVSGVVSFLAPEVLTREGSSHRSDIYSFGITALHVLSGNVPDHAKPNNYWIEQALGLVPPVHVSILRPLLNSCLSRSPHDRLSAREIRPKLFDLLNGSNGDPRNHVLPHPDRQHIEDIKQRSRSGWLGSPLSPPKVRGILTLI
jgi:hypothetical protein